MVRVLKASHSFTCTPRVHPLTEWTIPASAFPAEAGTHLPTPEGWKAELALIWGNFTVIVAGFMNSAIDREFEFYEFFSFLKFNEFYYFFRVKKIR